MPLTHALERLRRKLGAELLDMRHAKTRMEAALSRAEATYAAITDLIEHAASESLSIDECA
jgi:hypothetical protein